MKKRTDSVARTLRRQRALGRFTVRTKRPLEPDADYKAYLERKERERAALVNA